MTCRSQGPKRDCDKRGRDNTCLQRIAAAAQLLGCNFAETVSAVAAILVSVAVPDAAARQQHATGRRSFLELKERGVRSSLRCCGRSSCRRSGVSCGGFLFSLHVHVVGGLHTEWFPSHRGVLCGITGHMLCHPGYSSRDPINTRGATSGRMLSYVTPVIILLV